MEFCPNCGSRLAPKKFEDCVAFACPKCSYVKKDTPKKVDPSPGKIIQHNLQQLVTVIGQEDQKVSTMPTIRQECPKCGNNLVYVWQVQTRGGDEASTQFFRCTKCNHTYREMS